MIGLTTGDLMHVYGGFGQNTDYTVRLTVRMADRIDPAALNRAVMMTDRRYPYFSGMLKKEGDRLIYSGNKTEISVLETDERITLGSPAAGLHIWAVCFSEDRLHLDFYHGAADGTGMYSVLATLLFHYCETRYGIKDPGNILCAGDEIGASETADPNENVPPYNDVPPADTDLSNAFCLTADGGLSAASPTVWDVELPEDAFVGFTSAHDSTPGTMISILTAKAIDSLYPSRKKEIIGAYVINARPMLRAENIAHNTLGMAILPYTERVRALPFTVQCTVYRGMTFRQSDEDLIRSNISGNAECLKRVFAETRAYDERKRVFGEMFGAGDGRITYLVSYTGKWKYHSVEPYMKELWAHPPNTFDLMIEINAAAGGIFLSIQQRFSGDIVREAILDELTANGIPWKIRRKAASDTALFPEPI